MPFKTWRNYWRGQPRAAIIGGFATLILSIAAPIQHDYRAYVRHWHAIVGGAAPWGGALESGDNTYGPLYNLLSLTVLIHDRAGRVVFTVVVLGLIAWATRQLRELDVCSGSRAVLLWVLVANPVVLISTAVYGQIDGFVTALVVVSVLFAGQGPQQFAGSQTATEPPDTRKLGRDELLSGIFLALAAAIKYYPLVAFPFLLVGQRGVRHRFGVAFGLTLVVVVGIAWLVWGPDVVAPLQFAAERPSKALSIFRFLRGSAGPGVDLDAYSLPVTLGALAVFGLVHLVCRFPPFAAATLSLLLLFLGYKVGHPQFRIVLCFLVPFMLAESSRFALRNAAAQRIPMVWGVWLGLLSLSYTIDHWGSQTGFLREWIGLPAFVIEGCLLWVLLRVAMTSARREE